jgi:hypothetical protein
MIAYAAAHATGLPSGTPFHRPVTTVGIRTMPPGTKNAKRAISSVRSAANVSLCSAWPPEFP